MAFENVDAAARICGLKRENETTEDGEGTLLVVLGELGEAEVTLVVPSGEGAPNGMVLEVGFHGGRDSERLKRAILADAELTKALRAVSPEPLTDEHLKIDKESLGLWIPTAAAPDAVEAPALAGLLREIARAVSGGPPLERTCNTCHSGPPEPLERWRGKTVRMCAACRTELASLIADMPVAAPEGNYAGPDIDARSFRARLEPLRQSYAESPGLYWAGLVGWVLLGQCAMLIFSATLVLVALAVVGLIVGIVLVARSGAVFALKGALAKAIKLVVVAVAAAGAMLWNLVKSLLWSPKPPKDQYEVPPEKAPKFFRWVNELAVKVGGPAPEVLVIDEGLNASVAEIPLGFGRYRRVLTLGVPLLEMFDAAELEAILGHELGHLSHNDARSAWVYRTAQAWVANCEALADEEGAGAIVRNFTNWYVPAFCLRAQVVRREQELKADEISVRISSRERVASSLVKVHVIDNLLAEAQGAATRAACRESEQVPADLIERCRAELAKLPPEKFAQAWKDAREDEPHWLDSHPSLSQRLKHIGATIPDTYVPELTVGTPAGTLIDDYEHHRAHVLGEQAKRLAPLFRLGHRGHKHAAVKAERLRQQLAAAPADVPLQVELARAVCGRDADNKRAEELYRGVLAADGEHWDARRELVDMLVEEERWSEASEAIQPLTAKFPDDPSHQMLAVSVHASARAFDPALAAIAALLKMDGLPAEWRGTLEDKKEKVEAERRAAGG